MDNSLRSFLQQADSFHEYLEKYCITMSADQIEQKVTELHSSIKTIQAVAYHLANIANIGTRVVNRKRKSKKSDIVEVIKEMTSKKYLDPYPSDLDIGTIRSLNPLESIEVIKNIRVPIVRVNTSKDIPVSNLYYINDVKQFAINVEGIVIRGDIGNIVKYQTEQSAECEYGVNCKSFKKKSKCKYYHDPTNYIYHNLPIPDNTRNFTVGSWIYSKKKMPKTYFTRHVGSRDSMVHDLDNLKKIQYREEIYNREGQLIHDLLVYMILNSKGYIKKYEQWKHMPRTI